MAELHICVTLVSSGTILAAEGGTCFSIKSEGAAPGMACDWLGAMFLERWVRAECAG